MSSFPAWSWGDTEECTRWLDKIRADGVQVDQLELIDERPPFTRSWLRSLGITGIEYAAFKTEHGSGLGADYVQVRSGSSVTEPGRIYRLDGASYFIALDISEKLPFEDECFEWAYSEHLIEHVSLDVGVEWLTEVRRTLEPGGLLRVTTPDLRKYASDYLNGDSFFAEHRQRISGMIRHAPAMPQRPAFMLNQIFWYYGHRWIYDADELRFALSEAGFDMSAVRECSFRHGNRDDVAMLDTVVRNDETFYMEANR